MHATKGMKRALMGVVAIVLLLVALWWWVVLLANFYHDDLVEMINHRLEKSSLHLDDVDLFWAGRGPRLVLQELQLRDKKNNPKLTVHRLMLQPSLWQSLRHGDLRLMLKTEMPGLRFGAALHAEHEGARRGRLDVQHGYLYLGKEPHLTQLSGTLNWQGEKLTFPAIQAQLHEHRKTKKIKLSGQVDLNQGGKITLIGLNKPAKIVFKRQPKRWQIHFSSPWGQGRVQLPQPLTDKLPIQIQAQGLNYDRWRLGALQTRLFKSETSIRLDFLSLKRPSWEFQLKGQSKTAVSEKSSASTQFSGQFQSTDLHEALEDLGIPPVFNSRRAVARFNFQAPKYLSRVTPFDLKGLLDFKVGGGQILLEEAGLNRKQVGRFLGLLDLSTLMQSLLPQKRRGIPFSHLGAKLEFDRGVIRTDEARLSAPMVEVFSQGSVFLKKKTLDLDIRVMPKTSGSLPGMVLTMSNPLASAASFLVDKTINKKGALFSMRYTLKGPWAKPVFKKQKSRRK